MNFQEFDPESLMVLFGTLSGLALTILAIVIGGYAPLSGRGDRSASRITTRALASLKTHWQAATGIVLAAAMGSTFSAVLADLTRTSLFPVIADPLVLAILVFAGHRVFLASYARESGITLPDGALWSVILRALTLSAILFACILLAILAGALLFAVTGYLGLVADPVRIAIGLLMGILAALGSIVFARLSFLYPAAALGQAGWLVTAFRRANRLGLGLAASLWLVALACMILAILAILAGDHILALTVYADRAGLGLLSSPDIPGSRAYWAETLLIQLPFRIVFMLYAMASVACVSAAYASGARTASA